MWIRLYATLLSLIISSASCFKWDVPLDIVGVVTNNTNKHIDWLLTNKHTNKSYQKQGLKYNILEKISASRWNGSYNCQQMLARPMVALPIKTRAIFPLLNYFIYVSLCTLNWEAVTRFTHNSVNWNMWDIR